MTDGRTGYSSTRSIEVRIFLEDPNAMELAIRIKRLSHVIDELLRISDSREISEAIEVLTERLEMLKKKLLTIIYENMNEITIKVMENR